MHALALVLLPLAALSRPLPPSRAAALIAHEILREEIADAELAADDVRRADPVERRHVAGKVAEDFDLIVGRMEEEALAYPIADVLAGGGRPGFTAALLAELRIARRQSAALASGTLLPEEFIRRTHRLAGLLQAHLEIEDQLLPPLFAPIPREVRGAPGDPGS